MAPSDTRREVAATGLGSLFPAARTPRRIGPYRVLGALRVEGSAEVFLAREEGPLGFRRELTLRCVRTEAAAGAGATALRSAELAREARICGRLDHPAIVRVVDFFADRDRLVLAVEGAEAVTLEDLLVQLLGRDERLSDAAVAFVIATVAEALAHAHAMTDDAGAPTPVLHRGVSPSAIVIAEGGSVKLSGFGVAQILDSTSDSSVGRAHVGRRRLPPEEAAGAPPSTRGDVWAIGTLALQLLGEHDPVAAALHHTIAVPKLASLRPDLPRELSAALDAAAHRDPDKRLTCAVLARWIARASDLEEGRRDLRACVEAIYGALQRAEPPPTEHRSRRRIRALRRGAPDRRQVRDRLRTAAETIDEPSTLELAPEDLADEIEVQVDLEPPMEPSPEPFALRVLQAPVHARASTPCVAVTSTPFVAVTSTPRARVGARALLFVLAVATIGLATHGRLDTDRAARARELRERALLAAATPPAPAPSDVSPSQAPTTAPLTPPNRKLPNELGWLHVHASGAQGRVFVAARPWGAPEETIMAPCGRLYVNVAKVDTKGRWAGWTAYGKIAAIPCDGTVAEVSLRRPSDD
ncbi:MAG: protein kinase [Deltaproteobacteria bacterium]|nr:protein kinase [Deltaproteobacteria bacterium]